MDQNEPNQQRPMGMFDYISRYVFLYFIISTISQKFFKRDAVIKPEVASEMNIKGQNEVNNPLAKLMNVPLQPRAPVFPTHSSDGRPLGLHRCVFNFGQTFDMTIYFSNSSELNIHDPSTKLVWEVKSISFDWKKGVSSTLSPATNSSTPLSSLDKITPSSVNASINWPPKLNLNLTVTDHLRNNGSFYAHVIFSLSDSVTDPAHEQYNQSAVFLRSFPLVVFKEKHVPKVMRKLLDRDPSDAPPSDGAPSASQAEPPSPASPPSVAGVALAGSPTGDDAPETTTTSDTESSSSSIGAIAGNGSAVVGHWVPSLNIALVLDMTAFPRNGIPGTVAQHLTFTDTGNYYPAIYHDDFWLMTKHFIEINSSTEYLPLSLSYEPISFWKWTMQIQMQEQWRMQEAMGMGKKRDTDVLKEVLLETNPWLLGVTMLVSLLHMVFDVLAFKNDIQFWRKKKSMIGMSVRTIAVDCFIQVVVLLYLLDNETSWMVLFSRVLGILIEFWKLAKALNMRILKLWKRRTSVMSFLQQALYQRGGTSKDYVETAVDADQAATDAVHEEEDRRDDAEEAGLAETRKFDSEATTHLLMVVAPLVTGYSAYSLLHSSHKSFYSWLLSSLVGFVYAFGFVLMTPQLYINYRLKSVAHMPWKSMVYKALNTFIDDLFAFVIKMPTLHRLACFRDDVIFFIYLYQRWVYRVDYSRVNEFGQGGEPAASQVAVDSGGDGEQDDQGQINTNTTDKKEVVDRKQDTGDKSAPMSDID